MQAVKEASCQRISVPEAAKKIGCAPDLLRQMMKQQKWDLGIVVPPAKKGGLYKYYVFKAKLDKFLGVEGKESNENEK